jgi:hypothetical protein
MMEDKTGTALANWTILPPLRLQGVETLMVESTSSYAVRLAWVTGTSVRRIINLIHHVQGRVSYNSTAAVFSGLGKQSGFYIDGLERLTGAQNLRCGSFWILRDVLGTFGLGRRKALRRWCPECYKTWDVDNSWEPLVWDISLLANCPVHGCKIEDECRSCGAAQTTSRSYANRRSCRQCGETLGLPGQVAKRSSYHHWVDRQVCEIVELCAKPEERTVCSETYSTYIRGLREVAHSDTTVPALLKDAILLADSNKSTYKRASIRSMVNMCSLQAVSVVEMLRDPIGASSRCLINLWGRFEELPLACGAHARKARAFGYAARTLMRDCGSGELPPADLFLHAIGLNEDLARELHPHVYGSYQTAYRTQGTATQRLHSRRALLVGIEVLRLRGDRQIGCGKPRLVVEITKKSNVTAEVGRRALESAFALRRVVKRLNQLMSQPRAEAVEDPIWLKVAAPEWSSSAGSAGSHVLSEIDAPS